MPGDAGASSRPACDSLPDKPVDRVEPTLADRVTLEKRLVLGVREFGQGAIRQNPRGSAMRGGFDEPFDPCAGKQNRGGDPGEKPRLTQSRHKSKRLV